MVARGVRNRALRAHASSDRLYSELIRYDDHCPILFVCVVVGRSCCFDWPLDLIDKTQAAELKPLADMILIGIGGACTVLMLIGITPAIITYTLDLRRFRARAGSDRDSVPATEQSQHPTRIEDGLGFPPTFAQPGL
jgi:hypothetical protein